MLPGSKGLKYDDFGGTVAYLDIMQKVSFSGLFFELLLK